MTRKDDEEGSVEVWELPGPVRPTGRGGPETTRDYLKTRFTFIHGSWIPGLHVMVSTFKTSTVVLKKVFFVRYV